MNNFKPDKYQKDFCQDPEKAIRLLAPAGSGKTQSLLLRCRYMAKNPDGENRRFLIFSFTKGAANELKDRLKNEFKDLFSQVEIITLNAYGWRRLKNKLYRPKLITENKTKRERIDNTLQSVWEKHEILKDIITSNKTNSFANSFFGIIDGFKIFGFRHNMNKEAFFNHCNCLTEKGLNKHFDAIVIEELKKIEVVESNIDYGSKRLSRREKFFYLCMAIRELKNDNKILSKLEIFNLLNEKFSSEQLARKISKEYVDVCSESTQEELDDEIDKFKKEFPRIYKRWELSSSKDKEIEQRTDFEQSIEQIYDNFFSFWKESVADLKKNNYLTLDDQKYWHLIDLENNIKDNKYSTGKNRYTDVMVDEFQDINLLDLSLLNTIAEYNKTELTIVGDDDQAIYEWRGSIPDFIVKPEMHVSANHTKTHIFENNYRSPQNIVEVSQKLIKNNKNRVDKNVKAVSTKSAKIEVKKISKMQEGINFVLEKIKSKKTDSFSLIGRKKGQIIPYQIIFASRDINFYAAEDLQLFLSDAFEGLQKMLEIKDNIDKNPVKDLFFLCDKIKRYQIKKAEKDELRSYFKKNPVDTTKDSIELLRNYTGKIKNGNKSEEFATIVEKFYNSTTVAETIENISENFEGFRKNYEKSLEDIFYSEPPFEHLTEYAQAYEKNYRDFVRDLKKAKETLADPPNEDDDPPDDWKSTIHLMTALRAKGKEFDNVIVLDTNKDIWPIKLATTEEQLEQERRLFYVASTRARKNLTFLVNEKFGNETALPSPYLSEMELL